MRAPIRATPARVRSLMKLTVLEEGTRSDLQVDRATIAIERAIDNDVRITSGLVSRHHCRIESGPDGIWIVDLKSANGTFVNGERLTRHKLEDGGRHSGRAGKISS